MCADERGNLRGGGGYCSVVLNLFLLSHVRRSETLPLFFSRMSPKWMVNPPSNALDKQTAVAFVSTSPTIFMAGNTGLKE